ncbi:hypothetical protein ACFSLT_24200 [Novosphingobium resinovorum]
MSDEQKLAKGIDLWGVVALGLGTAVGVSIFSAIAPATAIAGPAMLLSVLVAALPMYLIAVSYAFLGSALPVSGPPSRGPRGSCIPRSASSSPGRGSSPTWGRWWCWRWSSCATAR